MEQGTHDGAQLSNDGSDDEDDVVIDDDVAPATDRRQSQGDPLRLACRACSACVLSPRSLFAAWQVLEEPGVLALMSKPWQSCRSAHFLAHLSGISHLTRASPFLAGHFLTSSSLPTSSLIMSCLLPTLCAQMRNLRRVHLNFCSFATRRMCHGLAEPAACVDAAWDIVGAAGDGTPAGHDTLVSPETPGDQIRIGATHGAHPERARVAGASPGSSPDVGSGGDPMSWTPHIPVRLLQQTV